MTTILLVILVLFVLYLAFDIRRLDKAVTNLAYIVNEPRRRHYAIQREISELEQELEQLRADISNDIASGELPDDDDLKQVDLIREKLDRRLRALAGRSREIPPPSPSPPKE